MKVVILAGGRGTRLAEETMNIPKPMVEIGGKPIIWHIMKIYSHYGFNEFVICLGYKGYLIKEYFANYFLHSSDVTLDLENNRVEVLGSKTESWKVTLIDTGMDTETGGRIRRIRRFVDNERFLISYGDGVSDISIPESIKFHEKQGKLATTAAVQLPGRFGALELTDSNVVTAFLEKPRGDKFWISGGYFVVEPGIFDYLKDDSTVWEKKPLETLAETGQLNAYKHEGFWKCLDTLRDKIELERMWESNSARWKIWG